jgi:antitoxin component of MazEF toxin-antitoxin module
MHRYTSDTKMRLQKHLAYKYKDKEYYKHVLTVPNGTLQELGWKPGQKLEQTIENGTLVIKPIGRMIDLTQAEGDSSMAKSKKKGVYEDGIDK